MTIDEWTTETLDTIRAFRTFWEAMNSENKMSYPAEMSYCGWDEQFRYFCEMISSK